MAGHARHDIAVVVNGAERRARVIPRMLLADVLREDFGLTGTHLGCEHGACGACTVLVDGEPTRACLVFAVQADGCRVDTVEDWRATVRACTRCRTPSGPATRCSADSARPASS